MIRQIGFVAFGGADRARRARCADPRRELAVADRLAGADLAQRLPHQLLEQRALGRDGDRVERVDVAREVRGERVVHAASRRGDAAPAAAEPRKPAVVHRTVDDDRAEHADRGLDLCLFSCHATVLRRARWTNPDNGTAIAAHVRICPVGAAYNWCMATYTGVVTTGIYCRRGCPGAAAAPQHAAVRAPGRGRGRGLPSVPALPPRSHARRRLDRRARARVPRDAQHRRRRARRHDRGRAGDAPRRERAPSAPPVRRVRRRDAERGRALAPRALRPPPARRHRPPDDADRDRGRLQHASAR